MMDPKAWLLNKKYTERNIVAADKTNIASGSKDIEIDGCLTDKAERERDLNILKEKLSSALTECKTKDDIAKKQTQMALEAISGWEKAETEAILLKQELDKILQLRAAGEEQLIHVEAALKECMQQLHFVREEQEKRIHHTVIKTSREFEKTRVALEAMLVDSNKRLTQLGTENSHLSKTLLANEKVIENLNEHRARAKADFNNLMTRLELVEKENASLKYEIRVLEKELEIRNEEREFNCRMADVAQKQNLENMKRIAKLESECQRLRLLVQKRLPGPAAMEKMKNEVELLGKYPSKLSPSRAGLMEFPEEMAPDTPGKRINFLTEQLYFMEEENKTLKELLNKRANELQLAKSMCAHTAHTLSHVEAQLKESSRHCAASEPTRNLPTLLELSLISISDVGSDDKISCTESWASALISELENFKNVKQTGRPSYTTLGSSDINLMDDFVEMEKLAIVPVDKSLGSSHHASEEGIGSTVPFETQSGDSSLKATDREMVLLSDCRSNCSASSQEIQPKSAQSSKFPRWLDDTVKVIVEQNRATERNFDEILKDIKVALVDMKNNPVANMNAQESTDGPDTFPSSVQGLIPRKPPRKSPLSGLPTRETGNSIFSPKRSNQNDKSTLSISVHKMIEIIDGFSLPSLDDGTSETLSMGDGGIFPHKNLETPTGYTVRVFQWKTSDLRSVLKQFVQTCNDFLNGMTDIDKFAKELTSAFEWIVNHCFSIQDVSSMKDAFKKQFNWDESRSESEADSGMINHFSEIDKLQASKEQLSHLPIVAEWNCNNSLFQMEELQPNSIEESRRLEDELASMQSAKKELEGRIQSEMVQLQELGIGNLQAEVETLKQSHGMIVNPKAMKQDLDTGLEVAKAELNEVSKNFTFLEKYVGTENKSCEELEACCKSRGLQLSMQSDAKESTRYDVEQRTQLGSDWEITAASEKLAECQETILNLERQLKALASPKDVALFDKVISTPTDATTTSVNHVKNINQRSSLLDKMLAENNAEVDHKSPKTKEVITKEVILDGNSFPVPGPRGFSKRLLSLNDIKHQEDEILAVSLAIVPNKKRGVGGLLKKLLWRTKTGKSKKTQVLVTA